MPQCLMPHLHLAVVRAPPSSRAGSIRCRRHTSINSLRSLAMKYINRIVFLILGFAISVTDPLVGGWALWMSPIWVIIALLIVIGLQRLRG